jgi:hypothetical protein
MLNAVLKVERILLVFTLAWYLLSVFVCFAVLIKLKIQPECAKKCVYFPIFGCLFIQIQKLSLLRKWLERLLIWNTLNISIVIAVSLTESFLID